MKNLAILPLISIDRRANHKNIKLVVGRPLFHYQFNCAFKTPEINRVIVVAESMEYSDLIKSLGVELIVFSSEISNHKSKLKDLLIYTIKELESKGEFFDNVISLDVNNPLNKPEYIQQGLKLLELENSNCLLTYSDLFEVLINEQDISSHSRFQVNELKYIETGCFSITRVNELLKNNNQFSFPVSYLKLPEETKFKADKENDLIIIEALIKKQLKFEDGRYFKKNKPSFTNYDDYFLPTENPDGIVTTFLEESNSRANLCQNEIKYINGLIDNKTKKIIDIGCGNGFISSKFDNRYEKYGLEVSKVAADYAKKYIANINNNVLGPTSYPQEFFDVVFSYHVIEHVEDPISFVENICSIMKTHGKLVLSTPNFDCAMARRFGDNFRMLHDKTHVSLFSDFSLKELLEDSGFQVDKIDYPFFETEYFTKDNVDRIFDTSEVSPPFYGNFMTLYATKK